jgi:transglutaminase-like putative cysteine protease
MRWLVPLPRAATRPFALCILVIWLGVMALVVNRSYLQASTSLATDLARYGSSAQWHGVYYRGEKLGFTVSQTVATADGFELQEDDLLQMSLLGATTPAKIRTTAQVDRAFMLKAFEFSLDPGTGPIKVRGDVDGKKITIAVITSAGTRTEQRDLPEPPMLSLNLSRRLADGGLTPGTRRQWNLFDPATLRNAPVTIDIGRREVVRAGNTPIPAFRVEMEFAGLHTTSWVTDTGEVVREESPMGLISVREPADRAKAMAVPGQIRSDLLAAAAVVPETKQRIDDPRDVRRLRLRLDGVSLSGLDLDGVSQTADGNIVEIRDAQLTTAGPADPEAKRYLAPELFIESDAPEIQAETAIAVRQISGNRARAEALTRYVNGLLEKKPTVSLPSAREVLRTKIGDCNEHTVLYVAMARAAGIPARIAVGLALVRGAFYYHAWPEVYIDEGVRGYWLPVDPTFNQFPADATHLRLAHGGLDKQTVILPLVGRLKIAVLDVDLAPGSTPILVGRGPMSDLAAAQLPAPPHQTARWCLPCFFSGGK